MPISMRIRGQRGHVQSTKHRCGAEAIDRHDQHEAALKIVAPEPAPRGPRYRKCKDGACVQHLESAKGGDNTKEVYSHLYAPTFDASAT